MGFIIAFSCTPCYCLLDSLLLALFSQPTATSGHFTTVWSNQSQIKIPWVPGCLSLFLFTQKILYLWKEIYLALSEQHVLQVATLKCSFPSCLRKSSWLNERGSPWKRLSDSEVIW